MTWELCDIILSMGKNAALQKMSLDRNVSKQDMRLCGFSDLQLFLEEEVRELRNEIFKSIKESSTIENLNAIRDEAADVIAFASGIVSKVNQEIYKLNPQPSLWDDWDRSNNLVGSESNIDHK
jgi:NTP pyrophosphatase (non-canonical NTP hydrolase)